jgi:hypothetical protein
MMNEETALDMHTYTTDPGRRRKVRYRGTCTTPAHNNIVLDEKLRGSHVFNLSDNLYIPWELNTSKARRHAQQQ